MDELRAEDVLTKMLDLLEEESDALLKGDAKQITELSIQKLSLSKQMESLGNTQLEMKADMKVLSKQIKDLADINHSLINQMNQHYTGMLSMMMRLSGSSNTYAASGYMKQASRAVTRRDQIIA